MKNENSEDEATRRAEEALFRSWNRADLAKLQENLEAFQPSAHVLSHMVKTTMERTYYVPVR